MADSFSRTAHSFSIDIRPSPLSRGLDLVVSGLGLLILAPVFLVIGLAVRLTSAGPMFYRATRVGQHGRPFDMYKFRTMYQDADQHGPGLTVYADPRITRLGHFLRHTRIDELPQLINVFLGEMSLVGPRPEDPRYIALYTPLQRQVLNVRPGVTSPASLDYQDEETLLDGENWETTYCNEILPRKLAIDLAYLRQRSLWTDLGVIAQTAATIINGGQRFNSILELRNRHFLIIDIFFLAMIPAIAFTLRLDGLGWWMRASEAVLLFTLVSLLVKIPIFHRLGLYDRYWRYASINDLLVILIAVGLSTTVLAIGYAGAHPLLWRYDLGIYPAIPLIDGLLTCLAVAGSRLGLRGLHHWHRQGRSVMGGRRVLIVGAGEAGNLVVREMRGNPQLNMEPIAFADDDKAKIGTHIQGLPVLGSSTEIPEIVHQLQIQRIVVAIPSAPLGRLREITAVCQRTGIAIDVLPGIYELLAGTKTISPLPDVNIHRLLGREPVQTDQTEVAAALEGSTVLITGAGGSIGSELCRQVARFGPERIVLLGHGENSIFEIDLDLRLSHPQLVTHSVIADIREEDKIDRIVKRFRPSVIFHAAAHKHVPLMEANVAEATSNNVIGTRSVLRAAERNEIQRFVLISTDKAIRPTSIMGATKRLAELLVVAAAHRSGRAYMAVRFGNVLGSRGSVVPVFQRQIAAGGPVTITHPDMQRYFMTIPEAVQLVLQATVLGHGGEVFMLDMGHPVRILDLALDLIRLSGLEPGRDIEIAYTGVRPGEKLEEELLLEGEDYQRTKHKKIFMATTEDSINAEALERAIAELVELPRPMQLAAAMQRIHAVISEHQPAGTSYRTSPGYETSPPGPLKSWPYPSSA